MVFSEENLATGLATGDATIHCTICLQDKPLDDFYPSGRGSSTGQCKKCVLARQKIQRGERTPSQRKKPFTVNPEKLMRAMAGPDPRFELASKILDMQQKTLELLLRQQGGK